MHARTVYKTSKETHRVSQEEDHLAQRETGPLSRYWKKLKCPILMRRDLLPGRDEGVHIATRKLLCAAPGSRRVPFVLSTCTFTNSQLCQTITCELLSITDLLLRFTLYFPAYPICFALSSYFQTSHVPSRNKGKPEQVNDI